MITHIRAFVRLWRLRRAMDRFQRQLPQAWRDLSEEEQNAQFERLLAQVRKERREKR